jgi:hypothetical protein
MRALEICYKSLTLQMANRRSFRLKVSATLTLPASVGLWLALAACATSSFSGGVYRNSQTAYRVGPLDATWERFHVSDCNLAFRNPAGGSIMANATCDVRDLPLDVLTNQSLIGLEQKQEQSREVITLDGRAALRTRLSATLDGVPILLDLVVLKKDGCTYDLELVAGARAFVDREADFWRFVQGFEQLKVK